VEQRDIAAASSVLAWVRGDISGRIGAFIYSHIAMQRDDQMCDADGLDNGQDNGTLNHVSRAILTMRVNETNVKLVDRARS
jgi:hypothetical protein